MAEFKQGFRAVVRPLVRALDRLGVSPLGVTLAGLALSAAAAAVIAGGRLRLGALLLLLGAGLDMVDGDLARLQGRASKQGAFLDSNFDRLAEAFVFLGLLWFYLTGLPEPRPVIALLAMAAAVGSLTTSYARARAEGLGTTCGEGFFQRPERMVLLLVGLLLGWRGLAWVIGALAALSLATTAQRIVHVSRKLAAAAPADRPAPGRRQP
ncbi:MAG: CDP-alcohol phosphatidyltransferase family protein [Candidatus Krumholzibacteriia bacterium]